MNLIHHSIGLKFLVTRFLCSPLEAIFTLLIFIAAKELDASPLQLALLAGSKPISSLFAFFLSTSISGKQHLFKKYLIFINVVATLPTLAFPFVDNIWFYIGSHTIFMVGNRAMFPIWNTILKEGMPLKAMSLLQAKAISIQQGLTIICPLIFGYWIDGDKGIWKSLFCLLGIFQLMSNLVILRLPNLKHLVEIKGLSAETSLQTLTNPASQWIKSWKILTERPDFLSYLLLFFWGGAGLVMMQSTLPLFFKEQLHLSYTAITMAVSGCKGIAIIASAGLWAHWVNKVSLFRFNFYVNIFSTLFIVFVLLANFNTNFIFFAYLLYGSMQAGCELSWNMNGPFFAKEKDSTLFSTLNLPLIGVRGLIFPFLGQSIALYFGANCAFIFAGTLCLASVGYAYLLDRKQKAFLNTDSPTHPVVASNTRRNLLILRSRFFRI